MKNPLLVTIALSLGVSGAYIWHQNASINVPTVKKVQTTVPVQSAPINPVKCVSVGGLPDKNCNPGAVNPDITQENIDKTICNRGGWTTKSIRPPVSYTNKLKLQQIKDYGYTDTNPTSYEEDHIISLQLGGSPTSPLNLWPEPYDIPNGARQKDLVENKCNKAICTGKLTLLEAQKEISTDWTTACK